MLTAGNKQSSVGSKNCKTIRDERTYVETTREQRNDKNNRIQYQLCLSKYNV